MKSFEERFEELSFNCGCDCGLIPTSCGECVVIAKHWYHLAYETIKKEIDSKVSPGISEISAFIDEELNE